MDPLDAQIRQVYFFDTPDLALNEAGVVVRARRVQNKGDDRSSSCGRSSRPTCRPSCAGTPAFGVEVDAMPGGYVCSGSIKGALGAGESRTCSASGPMRKLFTKRAARVLRRARARGRRTRRPRGPRPDLRAEAASSRRRASPASSSPRCGSTPTTRGSSSSRRSARRPRRSRSRRRRGPSSPSAGIDLGGEQADEDAARARVLQRKAGEVTELRFVAPCPPRRTR